MPYLLHDPVGSHSRRTCAIQVHGPSCRCFTEATANTEDSQEKQYICPL